MADDDVGGAFTGLKSAAGGLKNIVADSASALDKSLFSDPASRAALLQIGLNMMQPVAMGQSVAGHIGQAIGAGGEAVTRGEAEDLARQKQESEEEYKSRKVAAEEKTAEAYAKGQDISKIDRALQLEQLKQQGRLGLQQQRDYAGEAKRMVEYMRGPFFDAEHVPPGMAPYVGKQEHEIADMLRAADPNKSPPGGGGGGNIPTATDPKTGKKKGYINGQWVDMP